MLLLTPNSNLTGLYLKTFVPMDGKPRVSRTWCVSWLFSEPTHGPIDPETDEVRPRFRVRLVVSQGKNCRNRGFSGLLSWETEGDRLFLPGKAATLALSGGLGEISGDRRTRMRHTYPLPGSFTPQATLLPQHARLPSKGTHAYRTCIRPGSGRAWGWRAPLGADLPLTCLIAHISIHRAPDNPTGPR